MRLRTKFLVMIVSFFLVGLTACKKWEDHTGVNDPVLNENLFQEISKHPELSKFTAYLVQTGLDKVISSSKTYTVWAPVNDALQNLDPAIVNDTARLKQFISNHISNQSYYTRMAQPSLRVPVLNGKEVTFSSHQFDDANITTADFTAGNGVLHILDKAVAPLPNAWEYVNSTTALYKQNAFIVSQNFNGFDSSKAIIDSINSTTGDPVYKPGTGIVPRNRFNDEVLDLKDEHKLYTYFILPDTTFQRQVDSLSPYFKTGTTDSTYNLAAWAVTKDAIVEGLYTASQLPDTLVSTSGVKIPIDKTAILETHRLSNGIAYVMKKLDVNPQDKIPTVIVQGERPTAFYPGLDRRSVTYYRVRQNPLTGEIFNDIVMNNHGTAKYYIQYTARNLPSGKYSVYWVAVNDFQSTTFQQRLAMGVPTAASFPYITIALNNYNEVLLGTYSMDNYGDLDMYLTAANSTTNGVNSLSLDYIKLVPSN